MCVCVSDGKEWRGCVRVRVCEGGLCHVHLQVRPMTMTTSSRAADVHTSP